MEDHLKAASEGFHLEKDYRLTVALEGFHPVVVVMDYYLAGDCLLKVASMGYLLVV